MIRPIHVFLLGFALLCAGPAYAGTGRVIKVLPHFLDSEGRHTVAPSLYDRDAYQAFLRANTNQIGGIRFDIQWKASGPKFGPLLLRVELRGTANGNLPTRTVLETALQPGWFSRWTGLPIRGDDYKRVGEITAWRVSLWEGDQLLDEQKSFLW